VADLVAQARPLFGSLSVDLIFGHATENAASWNATVTSALALDVDHISTYALTVEPGTRLAADVRDGAPEPDPDAQADRYEAFCELAGTAGFDRYEVSNHARPGMACRYNLSTWAHGEYVAFGMAAHGHRWGTRTRNHRRIDRYLEAVEGGRRPLLGSETLDACAQERDRFMLGVRLAAGTPMSRVATALVASEAGQGLVAAGIMEVRSGRLVVTRPLLSDAVAREALSVPLSDC
jgi:oxygen-independent coproporphyrinogen-3 oxidase